MPPPPLTDTRAHIVFRPMPSQRNQVRLVRLLSAATLGLLALATPATAADYVGAEVCKGCHPAEYAQWASTGHASSLARLSPPQQRDRGCRTCHTTDSASVDPVTAGVQCESCHGAGALYSQRYVMKDKVLARLLGLADIRPETCASCHSSESPSVVPYQFETAVKRVMHKPPRASADAAPAPSAAPARRASP